MPPKLRGRSTSAERAGPGRVPCLGRTAIHQFVATLSLGDLCFVEWRIVPLVEPQPGEGEIPFVGMFADVVSIDTSNAAGHATEVTLDYFTRGAAGERQEQGTFGLPAQELDGAFIEFKVLKKEPKPLPSFAQILRKREREPDQTAFTLMQQAQQSQQNVVKDLVETLKSEEVKSKISLCPGLRIVEDTSDIWHPFQIYTWTNMFAATATDAQKSATSMAWKVELHQSLTDAGVTVSQSTNVHDLRAYNEARDQYGRWLALSDLTPLKTKEQWTFGFMHLFQLCGAAATLKYGSQRGGQLRQELITEFQKSAAIVDVAGALNRVFRGRQGGQSADPNKPRNQPRSQSKVLGTDNPVPGAKNEMQCRYCKKYHQCADASAKGREFWTTHRCK